MFLFSIFIYIFIVLNNFELKHRNKIKFLLIWDFLAFLSLNYTSFWLQMRAMHLRKMALNKKFHKTGGSHVDFHCWGSFCDVKKTVITAALPGDFFKDQKLGHFKPVF